MAKAHTAPRATFAQQIGIAEVGLRGCATNEGMHSVRREAGEHQHDQGNHQIRDAEEKLLEDLSDGRAARGRQRQRPGRCRRTNHFAIVASAPAASVPGFPVFCTNELNPERWARSLNLTALSSAATAVAMRLATIQPTIRMTAKPKNLRDRPEEHSERGGDRRHDRLAPIGHGCYGHVLKLQATRERVVTSPGRAGISPEATWVNRRARAAIADRPGHREITRERSAVTVPTLNWFEQTNADGQGRHLGPTRTSQYGGGGTC